MLLTATSLLDRLARFGVDRLLKVAIVLALAWLAMRLTRRAITRLVGRVERISDGAVAIRLVVRTRLRARWKVERELRARVKAALQQSKVPLKAVS
jgi:hypothetical protein